MIHQSAKGFFSRFERDEFVLGEDFKKPALFLFGQDEIRLFVDVRFEPIPKGIADNPERLFFLMKPTTRALS